MTTLWYRRPAETWNEALPIGNGRLGGMVFGGVAEERIALNDDAFWSGGPSDWNNHGGPRTLADVRALLAKGDYAGADELSKRMMGPYTAAYLPLGELKLTQTLAGEATDYRRELDLATAVTTTAFTVAGTRYTREAFSSNPDGVLAVRLTATGGGTIDLAATLTCPLPSRFDAERGELILLTKAPALVDPNYFRRAKIEYQPDGEGMRAAVRLLIHQTDGTVTQTPTQLRLSGATYATVLLTTATSFDGPFRSPTRPGRPESVIAGTQMDLAVRKPYATLKATHVADHSALFGRASLSLASDAAYLPTDELLAKRDEPAVSRRLTELLFQYGRYLLIASSRPGDQPANLQGIWNDKLPPPWSSNYTTNINAQMNYWPAEPANLAECHRPMLDFVRDASVTGRETARVNYGLDGWCLHHNSDVWRQSAPVGHWGAPPADPVWAVWPMGGVWLCQSLWEHYAFNGDVAYLRDHAYPVMKDACRFVLGFLIEGPDGRLTTSPSTSPEHNFIDADGHRRAISLGSTSDLSLIFDLFTNTIEAAGAITHAGPDATAGAVDPHEKDVDPREESTAPAVASGAPSCGVSASESLFVAVLRQTLDRLAVPRVLADGRVAEWSHDFPGEDEHHRHVSHLIALHPGRQWATDDRMRAAARRSLEVRGNASTGWSLAWKINLWARLGDGRQALDCVRLLQTPVASDATAHGGVYLNLFDAHPPFQIDGNFGFTAGLCEMLLQSHAGEIHLLPALPAEWPDGQAKGLRARGGVTVDLTWRGGRIHTTTLKADRDVSVLLRVGDATVAKRIELTAHVAFRID